LDPDYSPLDKQENNMYSRRTFILGGLALSTAPSWLSRALAADPAANLPFKPFDAHIHLFTDDVAHYPYIGIERTKQRVLTYPNTADKIIRLLDESGIECAAAVQYKNAYVTDNSYVLDSTDRFPTRFRAVAVVDASDPSAPATVRDLVEKRHIVGVRITGDRDAAGNMPWLTSDACAATIAAAGKAGIFIELMYLPVNEPNATSLGIYAQIADRFPTVTFMLDHAGWTVGGPEANYGITPAHAALGQRRNVVVKSTTLNFNMLKRDPQAIAEYMQRVVANFGEDKVIWGTDFGNSEGTYPELLALGIASVAKLTPAQQRKVLRDNGRKLFKA
jgi:predicted TIM-barrel fold metal-dependent hydrolase